MEVFPKVDCLLEFEPQQLSCVHKITQNNQLSMFGSVESHLNTPESGCCPYTNREETTSVIASKYRKCVFVLFLISF